MAIDPKILQETLRSQFFSDAEELVQEMNLGANRIQRDWTAGLNSMMRLTHNLKGAAQLSGFREFGFMIHQFESVCDLLKSAQLDESNSAITKQCIKKSCSIIRKSFEALKAGVSLSSIEQASWHTYFRMLCVVSLKKEHIMSESKKDEPNQNLDDWGLSEVVKKEQLEAKSDALPSTNANQDAPVPQNRDQEAKSDVASEKGWGLFDYTSASSNSEISVTSSQPKSKEADFDSSKGWGLFEESDAAMISAKALGAQKNDAPSNIDHINTSITERHQKVKEVSARQSYLICTNNGAEFAFPVKYVREILPNRPHKLLPINRKGVAGVISFRGQIMAILKMFDKDIDDKGEGGRCIVVCQIDKKQFGFRIDTVLSVLDVDEKILQAIPGVVDEDALVRNLAQIDGKTVSFVDPNMAI